MSDERTQEMVNNILSAVAGRGGVTRGRASGPSTGPPIQEGNTFATGTDWHRLLQAGGKHLDVEDLAENNVVITKGLYYVLIKLQNKMYVGLGVSKDKLLPRDIVVAVVIIGTLVWRGDPKVATAPEPLSWMRDHDVQTRITPNMDLLILVGGIQGKHISISTALAYGVFTSNIYKNFAKTELTWNAETTQKDIEEFRQRYRGAMTNNGIEGFFRNILRPLINSLAWLHDRNITLRGAIIPAMIVMPTKKIRALQEGGDLDLKIMPTAFAFSWWESDVNNMVPTLTVPAREFLRKHTKWLHLLNEQRPLRQFMINDLVNAIVLVARLYKPQFVQDGTSMRAPQQDDTVSTILVSLIALRDKASENNDMRTLLNIIQDSQDATFTAWANFRKRLRERATAGGGIRLPPVY